MDHSDILNYTTLINYFDDMMLIGLDLQEIAQWGH